MKLKPIKFRELICAAALLLVLTGCETMDSRIKEKGDLFSRLTPEQQQTIRNGYVTAGFTPDMVYMALGKPERVDPGDGPDGQTWIYHNFYSADGNSIGMSAKVTASGNTNAMKNTGTGGAQRNGFSLDYDPAAENIKAESAIKVHVKFAAGKVVDIQVVNNGR